MGNPNKVARPPGGLRLFFPFAQKGVFPAMPNNGLTTALRFFLDRRASPLAKVFFVLAVLYVLMPIDLVPDFAVVVGWIDDLTVMLAALMSLLVAMRRYSQKSDSHPSVIETEGVEVR
jgi:uncharacterized membrane protein YkvA (DUF1232 family)